MKLRSIKWYVRRIKTILTSNQKIVRYNLEGKMLQIIKRKNKAVVKYDGSVVFNNFKNNGSLKEFMKGFKAKHNDVTWTKIMTKYMKEKEELYINAKVPTLQQELNLRRIKKGR